MKFNWGKALLGAATVVVLVTGGALCIQAPPISCYGVLLCFVGGVTAGCQIKVFDEDE